MKKNRRQLEIFSLSFLDVVSCGFGAIVLLLVMIKTAPQGWQQESNTNSENRLAEISAESSEISRQSEDQTALLEQARAQRGDLMDRLQELEAMKDRSRRQQVEQKQKEQVRQILFDKLMQARQQLNEEMRRLQATRPTIDTSAPIGGVPVDSEYIIFVIDTSGSMQEHAWPMVRAKMQEILSIYPAVKGLQVMNDMGEYMFSQYAGRWIPDTPARRKTVLDRLRNWMPFSNSSPAEGIVAAIRRFYSADFKISIYIFGDDFSRGSIQEVVDLVDSINRSQHDDSRRVRIHAIGFPVLFDQPGAALNIARFAALMRRLAEDNDGSFVGLTTLR